MKEILLKFKSTETHLAGYDYGERVYHDQVEKEIDLEIGTIIVFPDFIVKVASSFAQGFISSIIEQHGYAIVEEKIDIRAGKQELADDILDKMLM